MASNDVSQYRSPVKKLVVFFQQSRDGWKAKHHEVKKQNKQLENQTRAVERSRAQWRARAEAAERRVRELETENGRLKFAPSA